MSITLFLNRAGQRRDHVSSRCLWLHRVKSKLENGHLSVSRRRIRSQEFEDESCEHACECVNHSDVPAVSKQPPCQGRPLCGLFTLRVISDSVCTRQSARRHTAHLKKAWSSHWNQCSFCFCWLTQLHIKDHTPVLRPVFSRPSQTFARQ